jgi:hypothetical protein
VRFLALILGLFAGIFALATPIAFKTDLMTPFIEQWASTPDDRLAATVVWSALPVAALLGGILCVVTPGFAALLLLGAGLGWSGIMLAQPALLDFKLLVPAGAAILAAVCAQVAGELDIHRRRKQRRARRLSETAEDSGEIEREAAFRIDPTLAPREPARRATLSPEPVPEPTPREPAPPPRRAVPLKFENEQAASTSQREAFQPASSRQETIQPSSPRRAGGFRWDDTDQPDIEPEPALDQPRPSPRFDQRAPSADRVAFVPRANPRRAEIQPELRSEPWQPSQQPYRRPVPQRRNDSLAVPISLGIAAVLLLSILAGLYVAHREGYLERIVTALQTATAEPAQPPASAAPPNATTSATAPQPASVAVPTAPAVPEPTPAATAPEAPPSVLPQVLPDTTTATSSATYADPFTYCTAVGTIDFADERYTGPAVIPAMTEAVRAPAEAPRERVHWRCAGGVVLACSSYAGPICDRAPTVAEMQAYCERNPNARPLFAPHGVWSCVEGKPQLPPDVNWPVDDRGFMPRAWIAIRPPSAANG